MVIKNISIIKNAEAKTGNALYQIEYSIINNVLSRVHAGIYRESPPEAENFDTYLGSISYENGLISCSLPVNSKATDLIQDFETFLTEIKAEIAAE